MARESLDQLARRLAESLPQGVRAVSKDIEENFRGILASGLNRLDLVTREEFDVQKAVLARTRAKLDDMEKRLAEIEAPPAPAKKRAPAAKKAPAASKSGAKKKTGGKKRATKKTAKKDGGSGS